MPTPKNTDHSSQANDLGGPIGTITFGRSTAGGQSAPSNVDHVSVSGDLQLAEVKLEESLNLVKEENVEIKIEDDSQEGSEVNSFGAYQYQNRISAGSQDLGRTWHTIDDIIALGLTLRKEVKEEADDLPVCVCGPPLEEENNMLLNKDFGNAGPGYDCEEADVVNPLFDSSGVSHSFDSFLTTCSSSNPKSIMRKRGRKRNQFKKELDSLFNSIDEMYHCNQCAYKAKYAQTMTYHRATHTGEKPYGCKFCDYKASHPTTLRRHMRRHTGEKPHACKHCDYKAAQPTALVNHIRCVHTGEKPYSCDVCPFRAHDNGSLASHKLTHLLPDDKPFECEVCGAKMTRRRHLIRHAKSKHPGKNISLDRRFSKTAKNRSIVSINAGVRQSRSQKQPKVFKRSRTFREQFRSAGESSSTSDEETGSLITNEPLRVSSDDQEYHPDRCVATSNALSILNRPRRSIVAPKKLDL